MYAACLTVPKIVLGFTARFSSRCQELVLLAWPPRDVCRNSLTYSEATYNSLNLQILQMYPQNEKLTHS